MANVLIRNIPDEVVKELKQRAKSHNRPLQKELLEILVRTSGEPHENIAQRAEKIRLKLVRKDRKFTDSADLTREDRSR